MVKYYFNSKIYFICFSFHPPKVSRGRESKTKQVAYTAMPVSGGSYYLSSRPLIGNTALQPILMVGAGDKAVTVSVKSEGKEIVSKEVPANTVSTFKAIDLQSGLNLTGVLVEVSEPAAVYSGHICGYVRRYKLYNSVNFTFELSVPSVFHNNLFSKDWQE